MKLRFSLRTLLLLVIPVAAVAYFCYLRGQPEAIARQFQLAIQNKDADAAAKLLSRSELEGEIEKYAHIKQLQWELESFDYLPQPFDQWLRGVCPGTLQVTAIFRWDYPDHFMSGSQTGTCEVIATADGIHVVAVTLDEPAMAGAPKPPYGAPNANGTP